MTRNDAKHMTSSNEIITPVQANLPQPEFRNISDGFMVTVFAADLTNDVVGNVVGS